MRIHARLPSAYLGQSRCSGLLFTITNLADDGQNQCRAQTLHGGHFDVRDPVQCRGRMRSLQEDEATLQQRHTQSQRESCQRVLRQLGVPAVQPPSDHITAQQKCCDGA
jgi:hypothetical protein